jgi:hypothetical protein
MAKTKLTLSIDEEVIKEAKSESLRRNTDVSTLVEEFLRSISRLRIKEIMLKLGVEERYVSYEEIAKGRPSGLAAEKVIRELRNGREQNIS